MTNVCKEICPIFSGICVPDECDIFKKQYSDLYDENSTLKDRITRLRLDVETCKKELITAIENNIRICNINFSYESEIRFLKKEIESNLKYISELKDRYEDVRGR